MLPWIAAELAALSDAGLQRRRRELRLLSDGWCEIDGRRVCNFAGNDYLGLAHDPRVISAAEAALQEYGVGTGASALVCGRTKWHAKLERTLAEFEGQPAAVLFPTGMAANIGTVAALVGDQDVVFCDRFNHASLVDGCRLSGAKLRVYRHDDLDGLSRHLAQAAGHRRRWIVTDSVFSMDGDLAPLPAVCDLAERFDAALIVDEAHATGVFGEQGRGVCEVMNVEHRVAVRVGTLSKALGTLGGFVAGSEALIAYLWNSARTQMFSTALPPGDLRRGRGGGDDRATGTGAKCDVAKPGCKVSRNARERRREAACRIRGTDYPRHHRRFSTNHADRRTVGAARLSCRRDSPADGSARHVPVANHDHAVAERRGRSRTGRRDRGRTAALTDCITRSSPAPDRQAHEWATRRSRPRRVPGVRSDSALRPARRSS